MYTENEEFIVDRDNARHALEELQNAHEEIGNWIQHIVDQVYIHGEVGEIEDALDELKMYFKLDVPAAKPAIFSQKELLQAIDELEQENII